MRFTSGFLWAMASALSSVVAVGNCNTLAQSIQTELSPQLSETNLITTSAPARWSDFEAPNPTIVVNVRNELDVQATVNFCTQRNIPFLAQNGGNGWATFNFNSGVLINLAGLNSVTFNKDKTQVTVGGGATNAQVINKAYASGALALTGNCNCVGLLGAVLGGGYGNLMGNFGFAVDNVLSMRVVTADGKLRTVTAQSDPDLFWGLRGAGANLGIVTSATFNSVAAKSPQDYLAWRGDLVFTEDKLEAVVQAVQDLVLTPNTVIFMYLLADPATGKPTVVASPFMYKGDAAAGRKAYASLYALGPVADTTAVVPYPQWNAGTDALCARGDFKPGFAAGFQNMVPSTWRQIWDAYVAFQQLPGAVQSGVLLEAYDLTKGRAAPAGSAAFANRNVRFNAFAIPWYTDSSLDAEAAKFGNKVRDLLRATDGLPRNQTYINFAFGDESNQVIYGDSLPKLKTVKKRYDPKNVFNNWFNIR